MTIHRALGLNSIRRIQWTVLILALCLIPLQAAATSSSTDAITVTTAVQVGSLVGVETIPLIGLTDNPEAHSASAISLYWGRDFSGWFPTWQLELSSSIGLLPPSMSTRTQDGVASVVLARVAPVQDRTYEVTLSYSAKSGSLAVKVYDTTGDTLVYADGFSLPTHDGPLYALSGAVSTQYLPVGTKWQVGLTQDGTFLPLNHFGQRSEQATIRLQIPTAVDGEYRVHHVNGSEETLIASITPGAGEYLIPIDLTQLPLGSTSVRLDYVHDDEILMSETSAIVVGRLHLWTLPLQPDRESGWVHSQVQVQSSEPYSEPIRVDVHATLYEQVWDPERRVFIDVPYLQAVVAQDILLDLSEGSASFPVAFPMPDDAANWRVEFSPKVSPDLATIVGGNDRLFSSHQPASIEAGQPYRFVVFPDTQNMSQSYPTVLTRMTDWVTANAHELGIAAVLHVGDITNHDTPAQWMNAYRSMSLLHGVVPYVLTLGNHDMTNGAGGSVKERGLSLINNYFSADEARRYSGLAGTMTPDRLENHYHLFSFGDDDYLIIALEFGPPDEALEWANEVAQQYPDHRFILLTHSYTSNNGGRSRSPMNYELAANPNTTVNTAHEMWSRLVRPNKNSFLVISGHTWPPVPVVPYHVGLGASGKPVFELLFDWQAEPNGGNGWLGLLTFHPDNRLEVEVYSPYLGEYARTRDTNSFTSHMVIDMETSRVQRITY